MPSTQPDSTDAPALKQDAHAPGGLAHLRLCLGVAAGLLVFDHATKIVAKATLEPHRHEFAPTISIVPKLFGLHYAENTGAAFSILEGNVILLAGVSLLATLGLCWWWTRLRAEELWGRVAIALVVSGAVGNLIDRIARGYVVDFFYAYWGQRHWPVFNIADSIICIGVGVLLLRSFQGKV